MTPLRLDTQQVKSAFVAIANSNKYNQYFGHLPNKLNSTESILKQSNFWTAGRRSENVSWFGRFEWCSLDSSAELSSATVTWQPGQPDNLSGQQNCLHLRILTNVSQIVISDRDCTSKFSFACQVK
jgi:hypothetical protein